MKHQLLAVLLPTWEDWLFDSSWAFQPLSPGIVGVAWKSKKEWEAQPVPQILHAAFVECQTGEVLYQDTYSWDADIREIQLWPGITEKDWIITWETYKGGKVLLYPMHWGTPLADAQPMVVDRSDKWARMGPIVFAAETAQDIGIVHIHPIFDDTTAPLIYTSRIVKKHLGKPIRDGFADSVLQYFWPHGVLQSRTVDNEAYKAGAIVVGTSWFLTMFDAEFNMNEDLLVELTNIGFSKVVKGKPYWRLQIAGGPLPIAKLAWKYTLSLRVPAAAYPNDDFVDDAVIGANIIAGPTRILPQQKTQATIVVAVGLIKKEALGLPEEQARTLRGGELICLTQDGQVVQECKEEIVEQVELCLVGNTVVGIDRIQRRWRLWRWEPLAGKEQFSTVQWLDEEVVHAHVVTNHENSHPQGVHFWLVEERPEGLKVKRCDGQTLEETEEPLLLRHYSLPYSLERSIGHWDWPVKKGIIGHEDTLLLIAADEQNQMVLYRVEAGNA